jgi:hypothetical protein
MSSLPIKRLKQSTTMKIIVSCIKIVSNIYFENLKPYQLSIIQKWLNINKLKRDEEKYWKPHNVRSFSLAIQRTLFPRFHSPLDFFVSDR